MTFQSTHQLRALTFDRRPNIFPCGLAASLDREVKINSGDFLLAIVCKYPLTGETRRECAEFSSSGLRLERFAAGRGGLRASCPAGSAAGSPGGARQPARRAAGHRLRRFHRSDPGGQLGQRRPAGHRLPGHAAWQTEMFKEGSEVKTGDLLFQIDPRPYQAQYDQAVGQVNLYKAQLKLAQVTLARDEQLLATRPGRSARSNSTRTARRSTRRMPRSKPPRPAWRPTSSIWISAR